MAVTEMLDVSCQQCGFNINEGSKFCSECGSALTAPESRVASPPSSETTASLVRDFAAGTMRQIDETGRSALKSDLGKKMAAGAAIGAVAAAAIPFIGWATGAVAGAGFIAYQRLLKK
jgi:uncharacterized membrane protein YvbJ